MPSCPIPHSAYPHVLLAHGGGGRLMHDLIRTVFVDTFANPLLAQQHDGARIDAPTSRLAFTTDSYVVKPLVFPGGDIGSLAVHGTVNDLAMCGARPIALSAGFILEEGLPMETLQRIVASMAAAAAAAGVPIATGDTKVVDRGRGDGLYVNTAGIGVIEHDLDIGPASIRPGDILLLNGDVGRHGTAIMAQRESLAFESRIESDSAPLHGLVADLIAAGIRIHCLRDCTRGGLATTLCELAQTRKLRLHIEQKAVPVREDVQGACELLGLDPFYVANEGRCLVIVPAADADRALARMAAHPHGGGSARIGHATDDPKGYVTMTSEIGATRILDMLSGDQLPRIC